MNLSNLKQSAPEYTVSGITDAIREIIYASFAAVKIRGEVSGLKISNKGHVYFSLKDSSNSINAVLFASYFKKVKINLTEGIEVVAYGSIDTFGSGYQIKIESLEYAGIGALMKLMEERKQKLAQMGIFDPAKKKPIPASYEIQNIGIITSATGAVIQDMINRITERYPKQIILFNVAVQGIEAPEEIVAGIRYFNTQAPIKPEVIIVARGGGSVEDLFCFNDEKIAIATSQSDIPIISAIGHEIDTTIIDFASDLRAATPTAAAEIVTTPTIGDLQSVIISNYRDILDIGQKRIKSAIEKSGFLKQRLTQTKNNILMAGKGLSELRHRIKSGTQITIFGTQNTVNLARQGLSRSKDKIQSRLDAYFVYLKASDNKITTFAQSLLHKINMLQKRIHVATWRKYDTAATKHNSSQGWLLGAYKAKTLAVDNKFEKLKNSISYLDFAKNLRKGYAIILDSNNKITKSTKRLEELSVLRVKMYDGLVEIKK